MSQLSKNGTLEILQQNEIWSQMLDASGSVIYVLNLETREVEYKNRSIRVDLGYQNDDLERPDAVIPQQLLHPDDLINVDELFATLRQSKVYRKILRLRHKNDKWTFFNLTFIPYHHEKHHRAVGTLTDVTKLKKSQLSFIKQKKDAEKLAKAKSDFLARMSHEIRTPLTSIIALSENLVADARDSLEQQTAECLLRSAQHLHKVVDDILDLAKIEAGKLEIKKERTELKKFINDFVNNHQALAKKDKTRLSLVLPENMPETILMDEFRMRQVLANVLGNALKFSKRGHVQLKLIVDEDVIEFRIKDDGCGIPSEQLSRIFDSYHQAEGTVGGTGLGLSISKNIIQAMNGDIQVDSNPGQGTEVSIKIPAEASEANAKLKSESSNLIKLSKSLQGRKILVVDDNRINLQVISLLIRREGGRAYLVDNPMNLRFESVQGCDLALIDYRMPGLSGIDLTKSLRAQGIKIPILAFTADCSPEVLSECQKAGMNDLVLKPFQSKDLVETLVYWANNPSDKIALEEIAS